MSLYYQFYGLIISVELKHVAMLMCKDLPCWEQKVIDTDEERTHTDICTKAARILVEPILASCLTK